MSQHSPAQSKANNSPDSRSNVAQGQNLANGSPFLKGSGQLTNITGGNEVKTMTPTPTMSTQTTKSTSRGSKPRSTRTVDIAATSRYKQLTFTAESKMGSLSFFKRNVHTIEDHDINIEREAKPEKKAIFNYVNGKVVAIDGDPILRIINASSDTLYIRLPHDDRQLRIKIVNTIQHNLRAALANEWADRVKRRDFDISGISNST